MHKTTKGQKSKQNIRYKILYKYLS